MAAAICFGVKKESSHKGRPIAYISNVNDEANLSKLVRKIAEEWNLRSTRLIVSVLSDEFCFDHLPLDNKRRTCENLKNGFKKLFDTDVRPTLFTSGRSNDAVAVAAGTARLEFLENDAYIHEDLGETEEYDEDRSRKSQNFKVIGVNSSKVLDKSSSFEENHTHFIAIEDDTMSVDALLLFRIRIIKLLMSNELEPIVPRSPAVDDHAARYVSLPVNNFYEIPNNSNQPTFNGSAQQPPKKICVIILYFGCAADRFHWVLEATASSKLALIAFRNSSSPANFLSIAISRHSPAFNRPGALSKESFERAFGIKTPMSDESFANLTKFAEILQKSNLYCCRTFDVLVDHSCFDIPLVVAQSRRDDEDMKDSFDFFSLLFRLNVPSLLNYVKFDDAFADDVRFFDYFEEVLINPGKEGFVSWFLESGLKIRTFLTSDRLLRLFRRAKSREFFDNVILGNLGFINFPNDTQKFVKVDLKRTFHQLTSKMVRSNDINFDVDILRSNFGSNPISLEKHCLEVLIFWSVLMKRNSLTKLLWSYSYDPVPLALILKEVFKNLERNSFGFYFYVDDLRDLVRTFDDFAVDLLNEADRRAPRRSYDVLCYGFDQYSNTTATHLAYLSENRRFIAHSWCQRWLSRLLFGRMKICNLNFGSSSAPSWLKVLLSVVFVFPLRFWVKYPCTSGKVDRNLHITNCSTVCADRPLESVVRFHSLTEEVMTRVGLLNGDQSGVQVDDTTTDNGFPANGNVETVPDGCLMRKRKMPSEASFCVTMFHFYNSPIAKYWLHLTFRLIYLIVFGFALSLPKCGNVVLDLIVWVWSFVDWMESLWLIYLKRKIRRRDRLDASMVDVIVVGIFLFLFMLLKIVSNQTHLAASSFPGRSVAALFLLYRCYSTLFTYLPMHSTLGPLLVRIRLMLCRDFVNFLILVALVISSFAVVIHSTIYPDYPANDEFWLRSFKRAWFTLFTTPIDDLNEDSRCRTVAKSTYCNGGVFLDPSCPKVSTMSYFVIVQYLIVIKLIAWPLLFALFGKTAKEIDEEADVIWKYQFYCMVTDFSLKPPLPPPLTPLALLSLLCFRCRFGLNCFRNSLEPANDHPDVGLVRFGSVVDHEKHRQDANYYHFWRGLARSYYEKRNVSSSASKDEKLNQMNLEISMLKKRFNELSGNSSSG